jgi:hypothetical protein
MSGEIRQIRGVLRSVRRRWMWHTIFRCGTRAALSCAAVLLVGAVAFRLIGPRTVVALAAIETLLVAAVLAAVVRALWPLTRRPTDAQVARFIEERCPQLEDRLVTAVECASAPGSRAGMLTDLMYRDAASRAAELDLDRTISRRAVTRGGSAAATSTLLFAAVTVVVGPQLTDGARALRALVNPPRLVLHVLPGDARVAAGHPLRVSVQVENATAQTAPVVVVRDHAGIVRQEMAAAGRPGRFDYIARRSDDFTYSVSAGSATSRQYQVTVLHPASVTSIDVHYQYPPELGLPARTDEGGGDVYAPAGTHVQLRIHTDRPVRAGSLLVSSGAPAPLAVEGERLLSVNLTVTEDGSYRVALTDADRLENPGEVEYFIRMLTDTPPDVRIVEPAGDRQVTPLDEISIAAHADDDRGVKEFDLVYSVRGGPEASVPFSTHGDRQSLDGRRMLYLEDLHVRPGDFVTYYARARDAGGGGRAGEARSDIFFLEVTPFDQEFMPPQSSQASSAGMGAAGRSFDELIRAQKEIVVATWRLDRRARKSRGVGSEADVKTIGRAQGDLKNRAIDMAGPAVAPIASKPGARRPDTGHPAPDPGTEGGDAMTGAIEAMGKAEQSLNAVNTSDALPYETRALNELLKAQASNRRWQMQQAARAGAGGDNAAGNADLSTLFEQELQRQQRTNYEMPRGSEQRDEEKQSEALERVRQMAQRQGELGQQQQDLARNRGKMSEDEVKRQLERLTREQSDLRQQAEQLAQQLKAEGDRRQAEGGQQAEGGGRQAPGGKQAAVEGREAAGGRATPGGTATQLRQASEAMREAASNLRDGKVADASTRSDQALDRLRSAEQQMRGQQARAGVPALGDLQMEAQQLAGAQRQVARQAASAGTGTAAADTMRRLAGEKERLADQVEHLSQGLTSAAASPGLEGRQRQAVDAVTKDLERLQLPKQMRDAAAAMRAPEKGDVNRPPSAAGEQDLANTLGRLADRVTAAAGSRDTQQAAEQLGQTREMRDRLAQIERRMGELQRQAARGGTDSPAGGRSSSADSPANGRAVGTSGGDANGERTAALKRLQDEYARELRRAADQLNRLGGEAGANGFTPRDAQALSPLSAPGFHQDYSRWEELAHEVNAGLERAETVLTKRLRDQQGRDRLQAPASARAPESYRRLVEQYYQSLAKKDRQ